MKPSIRRVNGLVYRQTILYARHIDRMCDIALWPVIDAILFGAIGTYAARHGGQSTLLTMLAGFVMAQVVWQAHIHLSKFVLQETWDWNVLYLMTRPIRALEALGAAVIVSLAVTIVSIVCVTASIGLVFGINVVNVPLGIIALFPILAIIGWATAILATSLVLWLGQKMDNIVWALFGLIGPLSGSIVPPDNLPNGLRQFAVILPTTHAYEAGRTILFEHRFPLGNLAYAGVGAIVLMCLAFAALSRSINNFRVNGLVSPIYVNVLGMRLKSTNPSDGYSLVGEVDISTQEDVNKAVASARSALPGWADVSLPTRIKAIESFVSELQKRTTDITGFIALETGRPVSTLDEHVSGALDYFREYCKMAHDALADVETMRSDTQRHVVRREPYGVIAAICPWNYPVLNIAWQCGQALVAGNAIVYKNSEENPLFAEVIRQVVEASSLPEGVFNVLQGDGSIGKMMLEADIDAVSFTGSSATGAQVAQTAARRLLPFFGELGGSSPCMVFEDVDIEEYANEIFWRRFFHSGQTCDSVKRLLVHESKFDETVAALTEIANNVRIGQAIAPATELGPLAAKRQLEKLQQQVDDSVKAGANVVTGGKQPAGFDGAYYEPTILTNVNPNMRVWREETFGPVLPVVPFKEEDQVIRMANHTDYGLTAYVVTNDPKRFTRVAKQIKSGAVVHNHGSYDHPASPFGGYKNSGIGRTNGEYGFHEVTQPKLISAAIHK